MNGKMAMPEREVHSELGNSSRLRTFIRIRHLCIVKYDSFDFFLQGQEVESQRELFIKKPSTTQ